MLKPCSPTWLTQPMITSSIASFGARARSTSASSTCAARSAGCHPESRPPLRPPAVRAAATIYASDMVNPALLLHESHDDTIGLAFDGVVEHRLRVIVRGVAQEIRFRFER